MAKRLILTIAVIGLVLVLRLDRVSAEDDAVITNFKLADILTKMLDIKLPEGSAELSREELYEVMSNMLAEKGITAFIGTTTDDKVTCGRFAGIVYDMLGVEGAGSIEDKINYLVTNGYMPACNIDDPLMLADATNILGNPALSGLIAEAYREPAVVERADAAGAPGVTEEYVASEI